MSIRGAMLKGSTQPAIGVSGAIFPVSGSGTGSGSDLDFLLLESGNPDYILLESGAILLKENTNESDIDG